MPATTLLLALGQRLRSARERRGLALSELAREAGLSRRYLTEAEAGRANPSILKLAALARALGLQLAELCDLDGAAEAKPSERIALVGLRGAGKTTIGRRLALALEAPFVELDRRVEELAGVPLAELFDLQGIEAFRRFEREALERTLREGGRIVIATSGSIVDAPETFARLRSSCRTLWLQADPEDHLERVLAQGDRRPVEGHPRALEELRAILAARTAAYGECELRIDTSRRGMDEVVATVTAWLDGERAADP